MFLLRAMFWIAAVSVLAPQGPVSGAREGDTSQTIANFRNATIAELLRVKAEFAAHRAGDPV